MDKIAGFLEVGFNDTGEVVLNHPDLKPDANGVGHIIFSPNQARSLATMLEKHASLAERDMREKQETEQRKRAEAIPVNRNARVLTDGSPVTADHKEINAATGQQKDYVVLSVEERSKGFVRPVRSSYKHLTCGSITSMGRSLAETYARDPTFYSGTFCVTCKTHFPLDQFVWAETEEVLGT